ncbi:hypothetical protein [Nonomuraea sediminis]|uniref:hypothetical protein n=1 Tax=Nonomuraea sediminis TaxID=2835864 RepID=UPI001BDC0370|nr:hypothetical protein [Nonomuraea sediminis]
MISSARRKSAEERLRILPRLERASNVDSVLVDRESAHVDVTAMWAAEQVAARAAEAGRRAAPTTATEIAGVGKEQVRAALEEVVPEYGAVMADRAGEEVRHSVPGVRRGRGGPRR